MEEVDQEDAGASWRWGRAGAGRAQGPPAGEEAGCAEENVGKGSSGAVKTGTGRTELAEGRAGGWSGTARGCFGGGGQEGTGGERSSAVEEMRLRRPEQKGKVRWRGWSRDRAAVKKKATGREKAREEIGRAHV